FVPEAGAKAKPSFTVGQAEQAVLAPAIGAEMGLVEWEMSPRVAVLGVIFSDCAPLALRQIGAPAFPVFLASRFFGETSGLGCCGGGRCGCGLAGHGSLCYGEPWVATREEKRGGALRR